MAKLCVAKRPVGSVTRTVTDWVPTWARVGVQEIAPFEAPIAIPAGPVMSEKVSAPPSGSLACTVYEYGTPYVAVVTGADVMTGGFGEPLAVTVTVNAAVPERAVGSVTRTTTLFA